MGIRQIIENGMYICEIDSKDGKHIDAISTIEDYLEDKNKVKDNKTMLSMDLIAVDKIEVKYFTDEEFLLKNRIDAICLDGIFIPKMLIEGEAYNKEFFIVGTTSEWLNISTKLSDIFEKYGISENKHEHSFQKLKEIAREIDIKELAMT